MSGVNNDNQIKKRLTMKAGTQQKEQYHARCDKHADASAKLAIVRNDIDDIMTYKITSLKDPNYRNVDKVTVLADALTVLVREYTMNFRKCAL